MNNGVESSSSRTAGSQTLARGLSILRQVTTSHDGLNATEVAQHAKVHRTVAYRILNTLCDAELLHRGEDNRYRGAAGLLSLAAAGHQHLRNAAVAHLRSTADALGVTVALLVREGNSAVSLAVVSPRAGTYHVAFTEGSQHPVTRGAAGLALLAAEPASVQDSEQVRLVRERGYAQTFGEVEPNMYGLAIPLPAAGSRPTACLNVITLHEQAAINCVEPLKSAAASLLNELDT
ncbi:helix-turn-helix domain-containing protein [Glutamicibacter arilaitensis]|uniref:IclR family transcriptional regulator domain-containing protein n=1 Tax=Glutamicibacter arilaitensis TaxID=256701 RepID=UPI00384E1099